GSITVFGAGQSGDVAPLQTIAGAATGLAYPSGVALDSSGNIYAANLEGGIQGKGSVTIYSNSANGNAAPSATITGPATQLGQPSGIAIDSNGQIYVVNNSCGPSASGCIAIYAPLGSQTGNNQRRQHGTEHPIGVALDSAGNIYVANISSVTVYPAGRSGNQTPTATIASGSTGLSLPLGIAIRP
ncbi:MAG: hypothetical protein ACREQI_17190, partial [Candidatus Binataceae bacterium]